MSIRSTPRQRAALARVTQEFADIRRRFDLEDLMREEPMSALQAAVVEPVADWEHLLNAVRSRLAQTVEALPADRATAGLNGQTQVVVNNVLESVAALDRLHTMLARELGNRQRIEAFDDRLNRGRATRPERRYPMLALLVVDVEDVRTIDDAHGTAAAEEVLAIVATRLTAAVRVQGTVRHLGGDAFACLLDDWNGREQLGRVAEQLADTVAAPVRIGKVEVSVRPTIGIARTPDDGDSAAMLLRCADAAMARAKRQRTGYAFFDGLADV